MAKNAKGNKTAHVLNLLTAPGSKEAAPADEPSTEGGVPETPAAEGAVSEAPAAVSSRPLLPPILEVAQANDDNLARQIQQALEDEYQADAPAQEEKPSEPPAAASAPAGGKMSQEDIEKLLAGTADTPAQEEKPAEAPVEEPAPPPQPEPAPTPEEDPYNDLTYINVMQTLVEEKAPRYIEMFGLCPCKRCATDVVALTLNNLVPKYVVMTKQDMIPMLTVYEGRFNSTIFAQLTRACKTVMDNPRHDPGHSK